MEKPTVKVGIVGSRSITSSEYVFSVLDFYLSRLLEENRAWETKYEPELTGYEFKKI